MSTGRRRLAGATVAGLALLVVTGTGPAMGQTRAPGGEEEPDRAQSWTCDSLHGGSKLGARFFQACFTFHGNVREITSPQAVDNIFYTDAGEGYAVCFDQDTPHYDAGPAESAQWGTTVVFQPGGPNTFPLRITRPDDAGQFELEQIFGINEFTKTVKLAMVVRNVGSGDLTGFELSRYVDANIGGSGSFGDDNGYRTLDSAILEQQGSHGLVLVARSFGAAHTTAVETWAAWASGPTTRAGCDPAPTATPALAQDLVVRNTYALNTLSVSESNLVVFEYRIV